MLRAPRLVPTMTTNCLCDTGKPYDNCCGRWHAGRPAPTAVALMRSRYTAFALENADYLLATWHPSTRPAPFDLRDDPSQWLGLKICAHTQQDETHASVEFIARYRLDGRGQRLHELSQFVREEGRWFYVSGEFQN